MEAFELLLEAFGAHDRRHLVFVSCVVSVQSMNEQKWWAAWAEGNRTRFVFDGDVVDEVSRWLGQQQ